MIIERISISADSVVQVGDSITFFLEFRNRGDIDLDNVRVQIGIPELGVSRRIGPINVNKGSSIAEQATIYIPYGTLPGEYLARIVVYDEEAKRVQHRYIWVYE